MSAAPSMLELFKARLALVPKDAPASAPAPFFFAPEAPEGPSAVDDHEVVCTRFRSPFEPQGTENAITWGAVCEGLASADAFSAQGLKQTGGKYEKPAKLTGFALARFKEKHRSGENVISAYALGLDFDGTWTMSEAHELFEREGLEAFMHSTFNDIDGTRFRVFVLFGRPATVAEYAAVWAHFQAKCGGHADENAKDASRFWYGPGIVEGRTFRFEHLRGKPLDLDALEMRGLGAAKAATSEPARPASAPLPPVEHAGLDRKFFPAVAIVAGGLLEHCPTVGARHAACFALAGAMAHGDLARPTMPPLEQVAAFVEAAARKAAFGELAKKRAAAEDSVRKIAAGDRQVTGWKTLEEKFPLLHAAAQRAFPAGGFPEGFGGKPSAGAADDPVLARLHEANASDVPTTPERVTITVSEKDFHTNVLDACAAIGGHPYVFQRNGELVRLVRISEAEDRDSRTDTDRPLVEGTPTIRPMARDVLLTLLSSVALFAKTSAKTFDVVDAAGRTRKETKDVTRYMKPEKDLVGAVHTYGQWPGVRTLKGIIETPLMRPDGSILQAPGHDPATGYLYCPDATLFPRIPDRPTREDARRALAAMHEVFCDFPYVDEPSRAVAIAALLTTLARSGIRGNVPAFILEAAMRGSGKGLQALVIALIATGRPISLYGFPASQEELGKLIASISRRALALCSFDNIAKGLPFGGDIIDAALTCNGKLSSRTLGQSEAPDYAWLTVLLVTANNILLRGDVCRRAFLSRLNPPVANARYKHPDLADWVLAERPRLVVAALTLLRAYVVAGRPDPVKRVASFEAWSDLIPSAIVWAGGADATKSAPPQDADEAAERTSALIAAWPEGVEMTADQLLAVMQGTTIEGQPFFGGAAFKAALTAFVDDAFPTVNKIARKVRNEKDVAAGGKKLAFRTTGKRWTVVPAATVI